MNATGAEAVLPARLKVHRTDQAVGLIPSLDAFIHPCERSGNSFKSLQVTNDEPPGEDYILHAPPSNDLVVYPNPSRGRFSVAVGGSSMALWEIRPGRIFPDPNQGQFTVYLPKEAPAVADASLWDARGVRIPINLNPSIQPITVSPRQEGASGLYLLLVRLVDGSVLHTKVIVQP
jgi:hypothetical protein